MRSMHERAHARAPMRTHVATLRWAVPGLEMSDLARQMALMLQVCLNECECMYAWFSASARVCACVRACLRVCVRACMCCFQPGDGQMTLIAAGSAAMSSELKPSCGMRVHACTPVSWWRMWGVAWGGTLRIGGHGMGDAAQ